MEELLARAEQRKHAELRRKLGLTDDSSFAGVELESLGYHLTERSGAVYLRWETDGTLRVGEAPESVGLRYRGEAAEFLLRAWGVSPGQATAGCSFEVVNGKRKA